MLFVAINDSNYFTNSHSDSYNSFINKIKKQSKNVH